MMIFICFFLIPFSKLFFLLIFYYMVAEGFCYYSCFLSGYKCSVEMYTFQYACVHKFICKYSVYMLKYITVRCRNIGCICWGATILPFTSWSSWGSSTQYTWNESTTSSLFMLQYTAIVVLVAEFGSWGSSLGGCGTGIEAQFAMTNVILLINCFVQNMCNMLLKFQQYRNL